MAPAWNYNRNFVIVKQDSRYYSTRCSQRRCSVNKIILRNFPKFTGKHLCKCLLFNKVAGLRPLSKRTLWHRCFPANFSKFLRTPFLQNTSGRLLLLVFQIINTIYFSSIRTRFFWVITISRLPRHFEEVFKTRPPLR